MWKKEPHQQAILYEQIKRFDVFLLCTCNKAANAMREADHGTLKNHGVCYCSPRRLALDLFPQASGELYLFPLGSQL